MPRILACNLDDRANVATLAENCGCRRKSNRVSDGFGVS